MKALVTGSSGFLGRHLTRALDAAGWDVVRCDLRSGEDARDLFASGWMVPTFDLVIHLAAVVGGREMIDGHPLAIAQANLALDAALFSWAVDTLPGRVVYVSSSAVYPAQLQSEAVRTYQLAEHLVDLGYPLGLPDQTYGWCKLTGEVLATHTRAAGVPVTVVRPFSGYGADQDRTYPFPAILDRALRYQDPLEVWGSGGEVRDWVHVEDVVGAVMACVDQEVDGPVNICTGRGVSFVELARMMADACAYEPDIKCVSDAPTGVYRRVGDPTLLQTIYQPRITVEEGIARAVEMARSRT